MESYLGNQPPEKYRNLVVAPIRIEHHIDASAQASKTLGFDRQGLRCYYRHAFTLTEERFDAEEFPVQVNVYRETVLAWRLGNGKWLKVKEWADRLDHCSNRIFVQEPVVTEEAELAL
jgi:hypothetical protein